LDSNDLFFGRLIIIVNDQIFRKLINDKCGVRFSIPVMHKWLHRHDLSYKKPKGFPHKANPQSQEFITEYEKLNKRLAQSRFFQGRVKQALGL
jgi:hypothetical protein